MYLAEATRLSDRIWGEGMPRAASKLFLIALAVLASLGQMFAQGGATGAITGTVLDPSGAVVAGAEVRIVNQDTGVLTRTTKTDGNGSFTATLLPVGTYTLSFTSPGFQEGKFTDIALRITNDRSGDRVAYHSRPAFGHPELPSVVKSLYRCPERTQRLGPAWARERSYHRERPT